MSKVWKFLTLILISAALSAIAFASPEPFDSIDAIIDEAAVQPTQLQWDLPGSDMTANRRVVVAGTLSGNVEYELYSDGLLHLHGANIIKQLKNEANLRNNISSIKSISFGNGVESIGSYTVSDIPTLETVYFSDDVRTIGDYAFSDCTQLLELSGLEQVRTIGMYAFSGCGAIKNVTLSEIERIGQYAFYGCSQLQTVMIGEKLREMQIHAFEGCSSLNSVTIASSVPDQAFSGVSSIRTVFVQSPASSVGKEAFSRCAALDMVKFDASVSMIDSGAFEKCASLTSVILPENLVSIGEYAFSECTGLRILSLPENLRQIGVQAFYGCSMLTEININAETIGNRAFAGCTGLRNVSFENPMSVIGMDVLSDCALDSIEIACESVPNNAFQNLKVSRITLRHTVRNIGVSSFENSSVRNLVLPSGVQKIDSYAFRACQNLESISDENGNQISVPASVTSMGKWIFYECGSLQKLTLACSEISEEAFRGMTGLESFTLTSGVRTIGRRAFMDCTALSQVDLGENGGVQNIGDEAFNGCTSIFRVRLPKGIKKIGSKVFLHCEGALQSIVFCGNYNDWSKVDVDKDIKKWTGINPPVTMYYGGSNWK